MRILVTLIIIWGLVFSAGCQANPVDTGTPLEITASPAPVLPTQGEPQMTPTLPTPVDSGLQNLIDKAIADLAQRLSIPADQITLVEATPVVWPDASLGCPQPGMRYLQVQQDGLLIRLQAGEQIYEYHSGGTRDPFLCVRTVKDSDLPPQIDIFNLTPRLRSTPDNNTPPEEDK